MSDLTTTRLAAVSRHLNTVKSVAQARAALGAALGEAGRGQRALADLPGGFVGFLGGIIGETTSGATEASYTRELTAERGELFRIQETLPTKSPTKVIDPATWVKLRPAITRVYVTTAGIDGALGELETFDAAGNLGRAILEAPGVLLNEYVPAVVKGAGKSAGEILKATGEGVGSVASGLGKGLGSVFAGAWWIIPLAAIALALYIFGQKKLLGAVVPA